MKKLAILLLFVTIITACAPKAKLEREIQFGDQTLLIKEDIEKVVVYDMVALDILDTLGIKVEGVSKNIVPQYLNKYLSESYINVGNASEPDFEQLSIMQPDLIIISGRTADHLDKLNEIAPTLYMPFDAKKGYDSFKENARMIGEMFHRSVDIEKEIEIMDDKINQFKQNLNPDLKTLTLLTTDNKVSAYGLQSRFALIHDILEIPVIDSTIESSTHGQSVNFEYILKQNPDVIYVLDRDEVVSKTSSIAILDNDIVNQTNAAKNKMIYKLDADAWYLVGLSFQTIDQMLTDLNPSLK